MSAGRGYLRYTCTRTCTCTSGIPVSIQTGVPVYLFVPVGTCLYLFGNRLVPVGTCFPALCISGLVVDTLILSLRSLRCESKVLSTLRYQTSILLKPVYLFQFRSGSGILVSYPVQPVPVYKPVFGHPYTVRDRNRYPVYLYLSKPVSGMDNYDVWIPP